MADRTGRWLAGLAAIPFRQLRCRASGWGLHSSCADAAGNAICPFCEQTVATRAGAVGAVPVRRIKMHAAQALPIARWLRPWTAEDEP